VFWFRLDVYRLYLNQSCVNFPVTNAFEPGEPFLRGLDRSFRRPRRSNYDRALAAVKKLFVSGHFIDETHAVAWHLLPLARRETMLSLSVLGPDDLDQFQSARPSAFGIP
jgi:hypothetical protein